MNINKFPRIKIDPPGPKSLAMLDRLYQSIGRGNYTGLYGICIQKAQGHAWIEDIDGNIYLDCLSGAATNNMGYDNDIIQSYCKAATIIPHTCFSYSPTAYPIDLAENLIRITPGKHSKKVFLSLWGSKSCEDALEVMWRYTQKKIIIKFKDAYHGATWLSKSASGFNPPKSKRFHDSHFITLPYPTTPELGEQVLHSIESLITTEDIAGVLIETILSDAGIRFPCPGFFSSLEDILKNNGVLLSVDEIQTGMGRTGKWWAIEYENVIPDLLIIGKALAGGYAPISALVGKSEHIDIIETGRQMGGTFSGHPPSAAAALHLIELIEKKNILYNTQAIGERLLSKLTQLVQQYPNILIEARGRGLLIGLEINVSDNPQAGKIFAMRCVEKGVYFGYYGTRQNVLRVAPPLVITEDECDIIVNTIQNVAQEMDRGCIPESTIEKADRYAIGLLVYQ
jgi:4-aminobutyrate aminotransferase-like enzyme